MSDLMSKELYEDTMRLLKAKDAEIERLRERLEANERAIASYQEDEAGIAARNAKLQAVVDAVKADGEGAPYFKHTKVGKLIADLAQHRGER